MYLSQLWLAAIKRTRWNLIISRHSQVLSVKWWRPLKQIKEIAHIISKQFSEISFKALRLIHHINTGVLFHNLSEHSCKWFMVLKGVYEAHVESRLCCPNMCVSRPPIVFSEHGLHKRSMLLSINITVQRYSGLFLNEIHFAQEYERLHILGLIRD